jgi:2-phosphoglycerate kinase
MPRPKVILIGGCPGAGKTTLGRALAARLEFASLTADDLLNAAKAVTSEISHPGLHVMNKPNFAEYFTNTSVDQLIRDAELQHAAIWPAVERTIRNHASWGTPIVIDGWHFRPDWIQALNLEAVSAHWLVIEPSVLEAREQKNVEFFGSSANPQQMLSRFLGRSLWWIQLVESHAIAIGHQVLRQDGTKSVDDLCREIEAHLASRG